MAEGNTAEGKIAEGHGDGAWEAVIGLETHVQLGTASKIFTAASTSFGDEPNTHIDPVVCGLPGTLRCSTRRCASMRSRRPWP